MDSAIVLSLRRALKELKIEQPYDPAYLSLGHTPRELHTLPQRYLYPYIYCFIHCSEDWNQPNYQPTDE